MRLLLFSATFTVIAVAVVWLLMKMSRSDAADLRLIALGLAVAAGLIALVSGFWRRGGSRGRS